MSGDDLFTVVSEVYRNERRSKVLTKLPINFYPKAEEYLAMQREEYSQAILIPSNPKTMMLQDQIKKVEKRLKHIYEIRERKIALSALDRMGGSNVPEHMTRKDKELYELLVIALKSFREGVEPPAVPERPKAAPRAEPMPVPQPVVKEAQAQIMEPEPETSVDAFLGNSGSPVINTETGKVEGILVEGGKDYIYNSIDRCSESIRKSDHHDDVEELSYKITKVKDLERIIKEHSKINASKSVQKRIPGVDEF